MKVVEQAERSAREERAAATIPAEIRKAVEKANAEPAVVDPETTEYRGGKRVLQYRRPY